MTSYEAYRTTVELTDEAVEIHRVGVVAKMAAPVVTVPLGALVGTRHVEATPLVNGMLQLLLADDPSPPSPKPSDPYTVTFRRKQRAGIAERNVQLEAIAAANQESGESVAVERVVGGAEARAAKGQARMDRLEARRDAHRDAIRRPGKPSKGVLGALRLENGQVVHPDGGGLVAGATAVVDTAGEIRRRITASRIVLTGVFALAWRKKIDERELYLLINGVGWAISVPVPPDQGPAARQFAAEVNAAGSATATAQPALAAPDPIEQIKQLASLRDSGILSADEFEAKKAELLGRL